MKKKIRIVLILVVGLVGCVVSSEPSSNQGGGEICSTCSSYLVFVGKCVTVCEKGMDGQCAYNCDTSSELKTEYHCSDRSNHFPGEFDDFSQCGANGSGVCKVQADGALPKVYYGTRCDGDRCVGCSVVGSNDMHALFQ